MPGFDSVQRAVDRFQWWWFYGGWIAAVLGVLVALYVGWQVYRILFLFVVEPKSAGFILRRGKPLEGRQNLKQGWHRRYPIIDKGFQVYLGEERTEIQEEARTKDNNLITLIGTFHWKVIEEKAFDALFGIDGKLEHFVSDIVLSALRSAVGTRDAAVCIEEKEAISQAIIEDTRIRLAHLGAELIAVPITKVEPHPDVAAAILEVQRAKRSSEAEKERVNGTRARITSEAEAKKEAARHQGEGEKARLTAEADGYLQMLRTITGNQRLTLDARSAMAFVLRMRSYAMRTAFANSGKASVVVLPDDDGMVTELKELVPGLLAHEQAEDTQDSEDEKLTVEDIEAELRTKLTDDIREQGEAVIASIRSMGSELSDAAVQALPKPLQGIARRLARKVGRVG